MVVAAASRNHPGAPGANGITVGGQPATLFARNEVSGNFLRFGYVENVGAGLADIVVSCDAVQRRLGIHVWVLENADMAQAVAANFAGLAGSTDVTAEGILLAAGISITPAVPNMDWVGIDERSEWSDYGDTFGSGAADRVFGADATGHAVSFVSGGSLHTLSLLSVPKAG